MGADVKSEAEAQSIADGHLPDQDHSLLRHNCGVDSLLQYHLESPRCRSQS